MADFGIGEMLGIGSAVGGVAGSLFGGNSAKDAAEKAAEAQLQASREANQLQRYFYDTSRQDSAPWRQAGTSAVNYLSRIFQMPGYYRPNMQKPVLENYLYTGDPVTTVDANGITTTNTPKYDEAAYNTALTRYQRSRPVGDLTEMLAATPGYQFQLGQGTQAIERSAASKGKLLSPGTQQALADYGQGLAGTTYNNYISQLMSMAGLGQSSTTALANTGTNAANQMSQNTLYGGNARASGYINAANANTGMWNGIGSAINQGANNYMMWDYLQNRKY